MLNKNGNIIIGISELIHTMLAGLTKSTGNHHSTTTPANLVIPDADVNQMLEDMMLHIPDVDLWKACGSDGVHYS